MVARRSYPQGFFGVAGYPQGFSRVLIGRERSGIVDV